MPSSWKDLLKEVKRGKVCPLQEQLKELGYSIADGEIARNFVGDSTKNAIRKVQRRLGLKPTGNSHEATAESLHRERPTVTGASGCVVRGRILQPDGEPVIGVKGHAFNKQLHGDAIDLGHDTTNAQGTFAIRYRRDQLRREGKLVPDLIVYAQNRVDNELAYGSSGRLQGLLEEINVSRLLGGRPTAGDR